jgi:pilus assembly protein CpaF
MLGERRSKAAFSAGFPEAVREETRQDSGHLPEEIMETEASLDGLDGGEGTEENFQNDSLSEQACEGQMHGKEDIWSEEEDIEAPLCTQKTGGRSLRTHDLFFASEDEGRDFQSVLQEIQAYLSKEYSNLVTGDGNEEIKAQIRRHNIFCPQICCGNDRKRRFQFCRHIPFIMIGSQFHIPEW